MIKCNASSTDLIDISGLCKGEDINFIQANSTTAPYYVGTNYWMQLNVNERLVIPYQKPNIEEINSVSVNVNIMRKKVIVTPNSNGVENLEGKLLTGRKLIVEGQLCQKVVYTACESEQSVHSAHFYIPFSAYIVVPTTVTFPSGEVRDSLYVNFLVNTCIEDAFVQKYTARTIYDNITILLQAVPSINC
jgi:hypothetical protein